MSLARSHWRSTLEHRGILAVMVKRDLRIRYARSLLGYLWTIIDPLAMAGIYFVVFAIIFRARDVGYYPYFLFLLTGLLAWQWLNAALSESTRALMSEQKMVRTSSLPRQLWVYRVVVAKGTEFLLSLPVLLVFAVVYVILDQAHLNWRLLLFPLAVFLQLLLTAGIALMLAPLNVLVNDSERVVRIILRAGFYATPIIYAIPDIGWIKVVLHANPLTGILELYRAGLFDFELNYLAIGISVAQVVLLLIIGVKVFHRLERSMLKEI